ncbi:MAG: hypothetical protein ACRDFS_08000 [Chloroflexota bacterium]
MLIAVGFGTLILNLLTVEAGDLAFLATQGLSVVVLLAGLIMLPFGLRTALHRAHNQTVLACPACLVESSKAERPFAVRDVPYQEYRHVTCSQCGNDFTVGKYENLV